MDDSMSGQHQGRMLQVGRTLIPLLEWILLLTSCISYVTCTGCRFPDFLQSSGEGMGDWTYMYGEQTIHRVEMMGGQYLIFKSSNTTIRGIPRQQRMRMERVLVQKRKCVQKVGSNKFVVEHVEYTPFYQCIQYIKRSSTVVQLKLSRTLPNLTNICQLNLTLSEFPWISLKGYKSAVTTCPFTGGLNFHNVTAFNKAHGMTHTCPHTDHPVRMESDCVNNDGIHFHIQQNHCVKKHLKSSHFLCMGTWYDEEIGDAFVLLRNANGDRNFYCLRMRFIQHEVLHMYLFLDWVCYRAFDLHTAHTKLGYAAPYLTFDKAEKKAISFPCDSEGCSSNEDCDSEQCLNTTSIPCVFSDDVIGKWRIQQANEDATDFEILKGGISFPNLGTLQCVTFNDRPDVRFRATLLGKFQNGCFPWFVCMGFEIPTDSVMRYRMGDVVKYPITLSDDAICDEGENFLIPPDITIPTDIYHPKPWLVALKSSDHIPTKPCILPTHLPRHQSFVSHDNRTGCINLSPDFATSTISIAFFNEDFASTHRSRSPTLSVEKFHCVTSLTYTSIITIGPGNRKEFVCWVVVDSETIVVIKTSACNEWTAKRIAGNNKKYTPDMTYVLRLGAGGQEVVDTCGRYYKEEHDAWCTGNENTRVERQKFGDRGSASRISCWLGDLPITPLLYVLLSLVVCLISSNGCVLSFARVIR